MERDVAATVAAYEEVTLHHPELREGWLGLAEALFLRVVLGRCHGADPTHPLPGETVSHTSQEELWGDMALLLDIIPTRDRAKLNPVELLRDVRGGLRGGAQA
jgi:hypothetical protein